MSIQRAPAIRLARTTPAPPTRIVHMGLGAFHRSHQAWYTARADPESAWGIVAFTGRSAAAALPLAEQDGLFTLTERSADGDRIEVVTSIARAIDGADMTAFTAAVASADTAIITLTITERGYRLTPRGNPDWSDDAIATDLAALRALVGGVNGPAPLTALARLVYGLEYRRRAGSGAIAVVPCDNIPSNGRMLRTGVLGFARALDPALAAWISATVSFVSTSVDRITPQTTSDETERVRESSGWIDLAPVVTEPFSSWVLSGEFPAGRPAWERAGALFVDDIAPYEQRKLLLLNGAHTLLAYGGLLRGHNTVAEAIADPVCLDWVEQLWDAAARTLPPGLGLADYRSALLTRFANPRIEHRLDQIARDAVSKLRVRVAPVVHADRSAGREPTAALRAIALWCACVRRGLVAVPGLPQPTVADLLSCIDPQLADSITLEQLSAMIDEMLPTH